MKVENRRGNNHPWFFDLAPEKFTINWKSIEEHISKVLIPITMDKLIRISFIEVTDLLTSSISK